MQNIIDLHLRPQTVLKLYRCKAVIIYVFHICNKAYMVGPSKFGAIRNSGYFSFLSISHFGEVLELPFLAELKTTCLHLNMVYGMYLSCNFE